jgi:predicted AAA+ superfamily ATPase
MLTRKFEAPKTSFFLLGPRGTGKSTWLDSHFALTTEEPKAIHYDLLDTSESLRLSRDPHQIFNELSGHPAGTWVVIDEIQKVPELLEEVHRLIERHKLRFVLSGSSARNLRRGGINLLAGRAIVRELYPLVSAEVDHKVGFPGSLLTGMLPMSFLGADPSAYLNTYANTYLQEEIKAEALTRNIGGFSRFLEVAARHNGQVTNVSAISRDAQVARQTVQGYFDVLVDTLVGFWLPAWKLKRATKQIAHPKFYFFDTGVVRALSGRLAYEPLPEETGSLLECHVVNEVRAFLSYNGLHYPIHFWSSPDGVEVDLFLETNQGYVAIEVKASPRWDSRFGRGLRRITAEFKSSQVHSYCLYLGKRSSRGQDFDIIPANQFLRRLWDGKVIR